MLFRKKAQKIFCIGRNKTGTTSLEKVLKEFGYKMGSQTEGEKLITYYKDYNWKPIIKFCKTAEAFQDAPFSWPYTWQILYEYFPKAKFILTVRDEESWYNSQVRFHSKQFSDGISPPNKNCLKNAEYNYRGYLWDVFEAVWKTPKSDLYNKSDFIESYRCHNKSVIHFFKNKPNFLILDVSDKNSYKKLSNFLEKKPIHLEFPHLNKSI